MINNIVSTKENTMILVEKWILESLESRTAHVDMTEPCIERGGNSTVHRGTLAQYLGTNIPEKIDLCHYCGNGKCSNPNHLYWGTRKENIEDSKRHGTWVNGWDKLVEKLGGIEAAREHMKKIADPVKAGAANKGKAKSASHKQNIAKNHRGGRKKNASVDQLAESKDLKSL